MRRGKLCLRQRSAWVEIDLLSEHLDDCYHLGRNLRSGCGLEVAEESLDSRLAELARKLAFVPKKDPQHLGDREDDLTVGDIKKEFLAQSLIPLLKPVGMAGWAETPRAADRAAEAGEPTAGIEGVLPV